MARASFLLVLLLCPLEAAAQADPLDGFDEYVANAVKAWEAPGLSVAVVKDGQVMFSKGYGVRDLGTGEPVDEHTLFAIGSTTKAMTAAALAMLADEGALSLDDRVIDHLPWFRLADPWVTRDVRMRDLLTHNVGLGNADFLWYEQDRPTREIVEALRLVQPSYSLRAGFIYQNIMYAAAGELIEAVSGRSWADFIQTRIFAPLDMSESVPTGEDAKTKLNVAAPHYRFDGAVRRIENASTDPIGAAGSVWSSAHDMARWVAFLLRGGVTEAGDRLISEARFVELFRPHAQVGSDAFYPTAQLTQPRWTTYGLGWFQADYEGRPVDFHTGSIDGMVAIAGLLRREGVGVYVLANRDHAELRHALMYRVFDLYDDDPARDWSAELMELYEGIETLGQAAADAQRATRVSGTQPSLALGAFVGTYQDPLFGRVEVSGGSPGLRVTYGRLTGPLTHWHYDQFRADWDTAWRGEAPVAFEIGSNGSVAALMVGGSRFARVVP